MAKPELKQIGASEWQCSECGLKIEVPRPEKRSKGEIEKHVANRFRQHVAKEHAEDVNQAAFRVMRESTEDR